MKIKKGKIDVSIREELEEEIQKVLDRHNLQPLTAFVKTMVEIELIQVLCTFQEKYKLAGISVSVSAISKKFSINGLEKRR